MGKVVALEFMSLDGVVQAPIYEDEDTSNAFRHGGWHRPYLDERSMQWVIENVTGAAGYLFGRGTYERFAAYWPHAPEEEQPLARPLNTRPKYVVSTTLEEPLPWQNSRLLRGDAAGAVADLKREKGDLLAIGTPMLVQTLLTHDLVDELHVMLDPIILGGGKRFFRDDGICRRFALVTSEVTSTGAILATWAKTSGTPPTL